VRWLPFSGPEIASPVDCCQRLPVSTSRCTSFAFIVPGDTKGEFVHVSTVTLDERQEHFQIAVGHLAE